MNKKLLLASLMLTSLFVVGCDNDGPMENAGEAIDNAGKDIGNAIEDACEDVKKGAGADDTDC